jgi:hypothetical protein
MSEVLLDDEEEAVVLFELSNGLVGVASAWDRVGVVSTSRDRPAVSSLERCDAQPATATIRLAVATATAVDKGVNLLMMTLQS